MKRYQYSNQTLTDKSHTNYHLLHRYQDAILDRILKTYLTGKKIISSDEKWRLPLGIHDPLKTFRFKRLPNPVYTPITARSFWPEDELDICILFLRNPWLLANVSSISASTILLSRSLQFKIAKKKLQINNSTYM